ncbi:HNH endonuclease [Acetobacter senegalensis]|uniref:HNH endonuclease n=1 Tax=Acetobacter senegalensis TaxID=446692 RepID=UPI00128C0F91|nr:hypothetical protein [Acetobacter senegalensis]MCG4257700.1 hypothetical protein [Acetobacter senegalensis]MCG4267766.1 hypothetical protein [Acetobacter senegalensis]MPQ74784.1 hypothetical protein [Acetobacter senegalensis]
MIVNPVNYSEDEQDIIDSLLDSEGFNSNSWGEKEIEALKSDIKQHYIREQNYRCCYCQQPLYAHHGRVWDIEHVISRAVRPDFMFTPQNLAVACVECNGAKGAVPVSNAKRKSFPDRGGLYKIVHPHFHNWEDHIELEGEWTYHALTEEGKFTIYHCDLFRFRQRLIGIKQPIRDRRFERDISELRMTKSLKEARPIIASIMSRLEIEDEHQQVTNVNA